MQNPEILIIGAAIIDILARPVNAKVFDTGSYPVEDIHMTTGGDIFYRPSYLGVGLYETDNTPFHFFLL